MQRLKFNMTAGRPAVNVGKESQLGWASAATSIVAVNDVPDDADIRVVAAQLWKTNIPQWVFEIDYSQLGRNLMRAENLNDRQWGDAPHWFQKQFPRTCQKTV